MNITASSLSYLVVSEIKQRRMQSPPSPTGSNATPPLQDDFVTPPLPGKKTKKLPKDFAARSLPTPSSKRGLSSSKTSKERESFVKEASIRVSGVSPEDVENAFEREPSLRLFDLKQSNDDRGDTSYSNNFSDPILELNRSDPTMDRRNNAYPSSINESRFESRPKMSAADYFDTSSIDSSQRSQFDTSQRSQYSDCLLYTSPSPRDLSTSRMPSSA